eukprot:TRINITY_DN20932_c0_g2_i1.p1 TRINITY_DN20932_c0_g2~~TRINITY_DN20932_c0_g2_i1.p1  ORF type:complete len:542 (-),score=61.89 TRINITY_DN20932_c0_g2_i1:22-1410(-)
MVYRGTCPPDGQDLAVSVLANPIDAQLRLGELKLPCADGGNVSIEQTLEVTQRGELILSLEDLTSKHPAHTYQQALPSYFELAKLLAPYESDVVTANASITELRALLDTERSEYADLIARFTELEHDMQARGTELWACLQEASVSERAAHLKDEQFRREQQQQAAQSRAAMQAKSIELERLKDKEVQVAHLDSEVSRLQEELETLGAQHWSLLRESTSMEVENHKALAAEKAAAQARLDELWHKTSQTSQYFAVVGTLAVGLAVIIVFQSRSGSTGTEPCEDAEHGTVKRERQRLLRLLARIRNAQEDSDESGACAKGRDGVEDFSCSVMLEDKLGSQRLQRVKVQCPGAVEEDVTIEVLFNGALITIDRKASQGVKQLRWSKKILFSVDEGHFQFSDAETRLTHGVLEVVFRGVQIQPRTFRFPQHFDMAYADHEPSSGTWVPASCGEMARRMGVGRGLKD